MQKFSYGCPGVLSCLLKQDVYTKMEALIYHFKIIMGEIDRPVGEIYSSVEGANGELGFI